MPYKPTEKPKNTKEDKIIDIITSIDTRKLEEDLRIDRRNLSPAWEKQPQLTKHWGFQYAEACLMRDRLKSKIKRVWAEIELAIREDPEGYGLDKVTEAAVKSTVEVDGSYMDAVDDYNKAVCMANKLESIRDSIRDRKAALDGLTQLLISGFYSSDTAPTQKSVEKSRELKDKFAKKNKK